MSVKIACFIAFQIESIRVHASKSETLILSTKNEFLKNIPRRIKMKAVGCTKQQEGTVVGQPPRTRTRRRTERGRTGAPPRPRPAYHPLRHGLPGSVLRQWEGRGRGGYRRLQTTPIDHGHGKGLGRVWRGIVIFDPSI